MCYLQQIDPCCYSRIFGEALDADMLSRILQTLKTFYIRFVVFCFIASLLSLALSYTRSWDHVHFTIGQPRDSSSFDTNFHILGYRDS